MKGHEDGDKTGAPFLYEKAERLLSHVAYLMMMADGEKPMGE